MDICTRYPDLSVLCIAIDSLHYVVVTKKEPAINPIAGPISNPRLITASAINQNDIHLDFQVFFKNIYLETHTIEAAEQYLKTLEIGSGYVICPGIPNLPSEIGFKPKKYREWLLPFVHHDSIDCQLWHKPSHHKRSKGDPMYV